MCNRRRIDLLFGGSAYNWVKGKRTEEIMTKVRWVLQLAGIVQLGNDRN